ncbi:MAG: HEAT repeat domain-containing protein [Chloroflexota bacterium]
MKTNPVFDQFLQKYRYGSDISEILQSLEQLQHLYEAEKLTHKERFQLQVYAFQTLQELTLDNPDAAESIILNKLLPACVKDAQEASYWLHLHRKCLEEWLEQYSETLRVPLRAKVLDTLHQHLTLSASQPICWTLSQVGFRSPEIATALWIVIRTNNQRLGDAALATLSYLGVPYNEQSQALLELHKRVSNRFNRSLVSSLIQLEEPKSLEIVYENWVKSDKYQFDFIEQALVFSIFRDILKIHCSNHSLQQTMWQRLVNLARERKELSDRVYADDLVKVCNSSSVVPDMLKWMLEGGNSKENLSRHRLIVGETLEKCVEPLQLKGWESVSQQAPIFKKLRQDACQDTNFDGLATTIEDQEKKTAWGILLRAKHLDALNWFDEAVILETSRLMQRNIIELFACFRIDPLPATAQQWIIERFDEHSEDGDGREAARRMAVIRLARSAATENSFDALLDFGYTYQGEVLRDSTEALAEVATYLVRKGYLEIISKLIETVLAPKHTHQSVAAAIALERVVSFDSAALLQQAEHIVPLLYNPNRTAFEKGALLGALGRLEEWQAPKQLRKDIEQWAREPEEWLGGSSLEFLMRRGELQENEELLTRTLGLSLSNGQWELATAAQGSDWILYFVGFLYRDSPHAYIPATISLLHASFWFPSQIIRWLRITHKDSNQVPVPLEIQNALIQRVHEKQTSTYVEPELFEAIAILAPRLLVTENWPAVWSDWLPDARVGLADALGKLSVPPTLKSKSVELLQSLVLDTLYAVRRAAFRGLARQSPHILLVDSLSWAESPSVEFRKRAAEAFGWLDLEDDEANTQAIKELRQKLRTDREKTVRETLKRTEEESRHRMWAKEYLSIVTNVKGETNEEILDAWCYAEALAQVGDDSTIEVLRNHIAKNDLPANVIYWLQRIIKMLEKNWRKTTEKWPEPWLVWNGSITQGHGKAYVSEGQFVEIEYSIWHQRASQPKDFHSWGGSMWPIPLGQARRVQKIELQNGGEGKIHATNISNERVIFSGTGPYPS